MTRSKLETKEREKERDANMFSTWLRSHLNHTRDTGSAFGVSQS